MTSNVSKDYCGPGVSAESAGQDHPSLGSWASGLGVAGNDQRDVGWVVPRQLWQCRHRKPEMRCIIELVPHSTACFPQALARVLPLPEGGCAHV